MMYDVHNIELKNLIRHVRELPFVFNNIEPFCYTGLIAGSDFVTHDANRVWIATSVGFTRFNNIPSFLDPMDPEDMVEVELFDQLNAVYFNGNNLNLTVDYPGGNFLCLPYELKNVYFSRLAVLGYTQISFTGYRLRIL